MFGSFTRVAHPLAIPLMIAIALLTAHDAVAETECDNHCMALQAFEQAGEAFHEGRLADARELLGRSLALFENQATVFNLSQVLREMNETRAAVALLDEMLGGRYGELDAARRHNIQEQLVAARGELATLVIDLAQAPATITVRVDGEAIASQQGQVDHQVDAGRHVVTASAAGFETFEATVEVGRGERASVSVRLTGATGHLVAESDAQALLEVAGYEPALGRLELDLEPGSYTVRATRGNRSHAADVEIVAGQTARLELAAPRRRFYRHPAFWIVVGALVAGGIGVGTYFAVREPGSEPPDVTWSVETLVAR